MSRAGWLVDVGGEQVLIGELSDATGVAARTVRYYEQVGLLHEPARTDGGYRDYTVSAVDRLEFIKSAKAAGLALRQIREILDIRDAGRAPCDHVSTFVDERLAETERRLRDLRAVQRQLHELRDRLGELDPAECTSDRYCVAIESVGVAPAPRAGLGA